jgi:hypothetical protein
MRIVLHGRLEALRCASIANRAVVCMAGETLRPRICVSLDAASRKTLNNSPAEGIGCIPLARDSFKSRLIQVALKEDG